jgi:ribosomal protein S12 methylthiotransferase RimO
MSAVSDGRRVALVTLGCARNEVDSEELAARLADGGWLLVDDADEADAVVVNTCGFVEAAKQESVDALLAASELKANGRPQAVVAVGCMAQRYGSELADALPEADAVLSFDDYQDIAARIDDAMHGVRLDAHAPVDRRSLLPLAPAERARRHDDPSAATRDHDDTRGTPAAGPPIVRRRIDRGPVAPLKLASGCDRRCSFCAIPSFRGSFISRLPDDVVAEAEWLARDGVREVVLVSENSTSYGKDLGDLRALESLLPRIAAVDGIERVRVAYLQPAETRPGLVEAIAATEHVADYYDLSFQHASPTVLRRMRRFGGTESFLALIDTIRALAPDAGLRSNVIVGFPGETDDDVAELEYFLTQARLDAVGVFGYSDEDGTEAAGFDGKLDEATIRQRVERLAALVDELMDQRAEDRVGSTVEVLIERIDTNEDGEPFAVGRAAHQGPDSDGETVLMGVRAVAPGDLVSAVVTDHEGPDLVAEVLG